MRDLGALFPSRFHGCDKRSQLKLEFTLLSAPFIGSRLVPSAVIYSNGGKIHKVLDDHVALCALQNGPALAVPACCAGQDCHPVILVLQHCAELSVHSGRSEYAAGLDPLHLVSEDHGCKVQKEKSEVSQRAAAKRRPLQAGEILNIGSDPGGEHDRRPDRAACDHTDDLLEEGEEPGVHGFHDQHVQRLGKGKQALRLSRRKRDRRFTEHRLSSLYAEAHLLGMFRSGRRDIYKIDLLVFQHLLHGVICLLEAVLSAELKRSVQISGNNRIRPHRSGCVQYCGHSSGHKSCPYHSSIEFT